MHTHATHTFQRRQTGRTVNQKVALARVGYRLLYTVVLLWLCNTRTAPHSIVLKLMLPADRPSMDHREGAFITPHIAVGRPSVDETAFFGKKNIYRAVEYEFHYEYGAVYPCIHDGGRGVQCSEHLVDHRRRPSGTCTAGLKWWTRGDHLRVHTHKSGWLSRA